MDKFTKIIDVKFNVDDGSYKEVFNKIKVLSNGLKLNFSSVSKGLKIFSSDMSEDSTHLSSTLKSFTKEFGDVLGSFSNGWKEGTANLATKFLTKLGNIFTESLNELDNLLKYSQLTDSGIRETKFTYGFSSSQAYGFDKAKSMLGISSDEDLMYMNDQQQQQFRDAFIKYSEKYTKLADSGFFEKIQEYNVEMEEFKEDLKLEFVDWFMNNKDMIKSTLNDIMKFTEFTMQALGWLLKYFNKSESSQSEKSAKISDVINTYTTSKSNVVTVTNNNTYNGANDSGKSMFERSAMQNIKQIKSAIVNGL